MFLLRLFTVAAQFGGVETGEENGRYGYALTFSIAYLRVGISVCSMFSMKSKVKDLGMRYSLVGESFETSIPWQVTLSFAFTKEIIECKN